ncbi:MAG: helix-turn-helix domain-containing protein [Alphaproteobacteria bacterium]
MSALLEKSDTVIPTEEDTKLATESSRILASKPRGVPLRVRLEDGQVLVLPKAATRLLSHLLDEMGRGNAVTVIPYHAELTTQEAADFLNVSRPYLIQLLEQKVIPFRKVGSHRRVRFRDLNEYKKRIDAERTSALDELTSQAQELGMGY